MKKNHPKGFTLIELILTMTLLGILLAASSVAFQPVLDSWATVGSRQEAADEANYSLNRVLGELAQIRDKNSITAATSTNLQFTDINSNSIRFWVSNGNLMRNNDVLARNVQNLAFTYYDVNENVIATPTVSPSATNIWRIRVSFGVREGTQTVSYASDMRPRNFIR